ncbi:hypothetical protein B7P43_G06908 [Cryptotermes secundus]|uniref:Uncharacterized protein n=1 Tax=Cryptotermes secundus TaxID=105785 RepID=A0A2J7PN86_9NEOP|nr:hypothetical protein B7P43_G06908 [Cryptotermes secundus]
MLRYNYTAPLQEVLCTRRLVTNCSRYLHCHEVTLPIEAEQVRRNTAQYTVQN